MHPIEVQLTASDQVEHAAWGADHDLRPASQRADLAVHAGSAIDRDGLDVSELTDAGDLVGDLDAQLARRREHQRLDMAGGAIDLLHDGDPEGGGLPGTGLRLPDQVGAGSQRRDGAGLDFGRDLIAHPLEGSRDGDRNLDLAKAVAAGLRKDGGEKCLVG